MAREHLEQREPRGRQLELARAVARDVAQRRGRSTTSPALHRRRARQAPAPRNSASRRAAKLVDGERLDEVVVGAGLEARHTLDDLRQARRQHADRHAVPAPAQRPRHGDPVEVGQPDVEHDRVGRATRRAAQARRRRRPPRRPRSPHGARATIADRTAGSSSTTRTRVVMAALLSVIPKSGLKRASARRLGNLSVMAMISFARGVPAPECPAGRGAGGLRACRHRARRPDDPLVRPVVRATRRCASGSPTGTASTRRVSS